MVREQKAIWISRRLHLFVGILRKESSWRRKSASWNGIEYMNAEEYLKALPVRAILTY